LSTACIGSLLSYWHYLTKKPLSLSSNTVRFRHRDKIYFYLLKSFKSYHFTYHYLLPIYLSNYHFTSMVSHHILHVVLSRLAMDLNEHQWYKCKMVKVTNFKHFFCKTSKL